MDAHAVPTLILELEDQAAEFSPATDGDASVRGSKTLGTTMTMGKERDNDFVCGSSFASRHHARIEFQHNDFFLVDHSTNGSYVQTEDEQVTHVHRGKLRLWGAGWISLGSPLHIATPIHFRQGA